MHYYRFIQALRHSIRTFSHASCGTSSVEFALFAGLVGIPLVLGIIDVGTLLNTQHSLSRAVREAAVQTARADNPEAHGEATLRAALTAAGLQDARASVSFEAPDNYEPGSPLRVTVHYDVDDLPLMDVHGVYPATLTARMAVKRGS